MCAANVWLPMFFFQAEDGIRVGTVTGVQTCALPIYGASDKRRFGTGGQRNGIERTVRGAVGSGLGDFMKLGSGRVLSLGQAVDAIVEKENLDADVSAQIGRASCRERVERSGYVGWSA